MRPGVIHRPGDLPGELHDTLVAVANAMEPARDGWWIIAGAAVALHGAPVAVGDVDLLLSRQDAERLLPALGIAPEAGEPSERFRSALFGRWLMPPLAVEFMAGFAIRVGDDWAPVAPVTRLPMSLGQDVTVFVPAIGEMASLLRACGRPKDMERLQLLASTEAWRSGDRPPIGAPQL